MFSTLHCKYFLELSVLYWFEDTGGGWANNSLQMPFAQERVLLSCTGLDVVTVTLTYPALFQREPELYGET